MTASAGNGSSPLRPLLLIALDGASFDVIDPMVAAGQLPCLGGWISGGKAHPLASTIPPVTFPAWSSFMTGLEPGEHGIFDFSQKLPGEYRIRFLNASDRRGETLQAAVCGAGGRVLVLGLPATYPPESLDGLLVPGFDAPVSNASDAESTSNPPLYRRIAARAGPWMRPDLDESARGEDFHETAVATLLARIERKTEFARIALEEMKADGGRPELMWVVFSESDTVGHHYWRDHDPGSPRHDPHASPRRRTAVADVYRALDRACARLRDAYGEDALCVVASDHGMGGAADFVVYMNRYLAQNGLLARRKRRWLEWDRSAQWLRDAALGWLPPGLAQILFRRARGAAAGLESTIRFGGFDWTRTLAFCEEANTQPGLWINLAGREKRGCVSPEDYEELRDRILALLRQWRLPNGNPVIARATRREEIYRGPFVARAPDIVIELALDRGYGLSLVPTPWQHGEAVACARGQTPGPPPAIERLEGDALGGGRGRGMNGTHRNHGIFIASGARGDESSLPAPTSLVEVPKALARAMGLRWQTKGEESALEPVAYTPEEEERVAGRLRALGYLD
jgi:predicted AlkP superfamily phosphohydrolase/phosphomutase